MTGFDVYARFKAVDGVSSVVSKLNTSIARFERPVLVRLNTSAAMRNLSVLRAKMQNLGAIGKNLAMGGFRGLVVGAGILASAALPLNVARKYELAFKDVTKSVNGSDEAMAKLRLGMKDFQGASFADLSVVVAEAGKMGMTAETVLEFSEKVVKGSKALDFSATEAVEQVGKILTMTNQMENALGASGKIMDMVAHLENSMDSVKAKNILNVWSRLSDKFGDLGFDNTVMAGMSGFLTQMSVSPELAASGFKMMFNRFQKLEGTLGFMDVIKKKGIAGLEEVMAEISLATPEEQIKLFGEEAMRTINLLLKPQNMAKLKKAVDLAGSSAGAVDREWAKFIKTFDERLASTKKNLDNLFDSIGKPMLRFAKDFLDFIDPIIKDINIWVKANEDLVSTFIQFATYGGGLIFVIASLTMTLGGLLWVVGLLFSPLTLVVLAIGAFLAICWAMYDFFGTTGLIVTILIFTAAIFKLGIAFNFLTLPITLVIVKFLLVISLIAGAIYLWNKWWGLDVGDEGGEKFKKDFGEFTQKGGDYGIPKKFEVAQFLSSRASGEGQSEYMKPNPYARGGSTNYSKTDKTVTNKVELDINLKNGKMGLKKADDWTKKNLRLNDKKNSGFNASDYAIW